MNSPVNRLDRGAGERGEAALEAPILAVALLLLLGLIVFAGRYVTAQNAVSEAARAAARAASIARDGYAAAGAARTEAVRVLGRQIDCAPATATDDSTPTDRPPGQPANVTATVACVVPMAQLSLPGIGGSTTLIATWTSPIDRYGQRTRRGGTP